MNTNQAGGQLDEFRQKRQRVEEEVDADAAKKLDEDRVRARARRAFLCSCALVRDF
jgi:hypothetical protein